MGFILITFISKLFKVFRILKVVTRQVPRVSNNMLGKNSSLQVIIARFSIPCVLVSNNDPPFSASDFKKFCEVHNIKLLQIAPYNPRSDGLSEREVQLVKNLAEIHFRRQSAHQKFKALAPEKVGHNKNAKLPMSKVLQFPELRVNPFGDRICQVFSSSQDGDCTFEDFLDMMSVFSDAAPKAVKAEHAFRIFDFDGDDMLGIHDLQKVIERLTGSQHLSEQEMQLVIQNLLEEADLDDDGALSFAEFEHIINKSSDFVNTFRIRL